MHLPFFFPWFLPKSSLFMNSYLLSVLGERVQGKLKMSLFGGESASALFWCTVSIRTQVGHNSFTQTRPLTQCPHPSASNWTDSFGTPSKEGLALGTFCNIYRSQLQGKISTDIMPECWSLLAGSMLEAPKG